jgi:hypothetical protein
LARADTHLAVFSRFDGSRRQPFPPDPCQRRRRTCGQAQRLRYDVFVDELGGDGTLVDHDARIEADRFDPYLRPSPPARPCAGRKASRSSASTVVMRADQALLQGSSIPRTSTIWRRYGSRIARLLELGRSCLHRDYRGGSAMMHLWNGLADYIADPPDRGDVRRGQLSRYRRGGTSRGRFRCSTIATSRLADVRPRARGDGLSCRWT